MPGDAFAISFVDMAAPPWTYVTGGAGVLDPAARATLDRELRE